MIPRWIVTRIKTSRGIATPGRDSMLNCDTGSLFHVELWPKLSWNLGLGSQFNVEFWPGIIIQRGILTRGYNSTWNSDPVYISSTRGIATQKKVSKFNSVIRIQQLRRVIIQRKIHWKLTPGRYSIGGGQNFILHRHWPAASIARVSCSSLFFPSDVLPFCVRNWGRRPFDSEGGWHFVEIKYSDLENAENNNLSSSVKKTNNLTLTFLQFGGLPMFPIYFC